MWWLLTLLACENEEELADCTHDPPLTYENYGQGFLEQYCTGCHSSLYPEGMRNDAPLTVDFDSYEKVLVWRERIRARTGPTDADMPPGGGATEAEYVQFREWLDCDAADDAAIYFGEGE